jgi:8-oxo-dGTP pyrophosphatase MutT (NUDIX family)
MNFIDWNGKEHTLPKNKQVSWRPCATAIILDNNKLLLIKSKSHGLWELPGGGIEINESIAEGLIREVFEETGYKIKITNQLPIYLNDNNFYALDLDTYFRSIQMVFLSTIENKKQETKHINFEEEIIEIKWFNLNALPEKEIHSRTLSVLKNLKK